MTLMVQCSAGLEARGVDLTRPLTIEFPVAVANEASARIVAATMIEAGYQSQIEYDEGEPDYNPDTDDAEQFGPSWTVFANVQMVPQYDEIIRIQAELDQISRPWGGKSDGWGVVLDCGTEE